MTKIRGFTVIEIWGIKFTDSAKLIGRKMMIFTI